MPDKSSSTSNDRPERVFLIDSMSHIFRAFYAPMQNRVAPLATSHGQVTQAVYIFTNMLIKLLREEKPDYIAAIFESKEKTFRHETFADYKANREAMPEDLATQLPYIIRLCEAFNIPVINPNKIKYLIPIIHNPKPVNTETTIISIIKLTM